MRLLILLFSSVLIAGCATIFSGTSNEISFSSNVDPVKVYVGGLLVGETPLSVDIEKKAGKGQLIRIEKSGYTAQEFNLKNKFDMIAILDISSPVTSGGIDLISGAIKEYSPRHYHIELIKAENMSAVENTQQLEFVNFVLTHSEAIKQNLAKGEGESLEAMQLLVNQGKSDDGFTKWLNNNSELIIASASPADVLTTLRSSGMTP